MDKIIRANYHTHTTRCGHASGSDREYVESAIKAGIRVLGFSDHSPMPFKSSYRSGMRMSLEQTEQYFRSVTDLAKEYKKDITIYAGVEAEYFPEIFPDLVEFLSSYPLDYMICGQHFIDMEYGTHYMGSRFSEEWILSRYVDNVCDAIKSGRFLYVAHPDLPQFTGDSAIYEKQMFRLCECAKEHNVPLELNVLGYDKNPLSPPYPTRRFFKIASKVGNKVVMGIDAHSPSALMNFESQRILADFAKGLGITLTPCDDLLDRR